MTFFHLRCSQSYADIFRLKKFSAQLISINIYFFKTILLLLLLFATNMGNFMQTATRKRSRRHLSETDEFVSNNNENILSDPVALSTAYKKMKSICLNIRNEIRTDIEIHNQDLLPR